jgi:hypothetical protein
MVAKAARFGSRASRSGLFLAKAVFPASLAIGLPGAAHAQLLDRYYPANVPAYQDWAQQAAPQENDSIYGPLGVRVGSFVIEPNVTEAIGYDSNPFGIAGGKGSADNNLSGSVAVNSDWARNSINAALSVDRVDYFSYPGQSYTTWAATAGGVVNYGDDVIQAGYSHLNAVTLPTDVGTFGVAQPITDQVDDFRISDTIGPGRVTFVPAIVGEIDRFTSQGGQGAQSAAAAGLFDLDTLDTSLTAGYEFSGGHNALVVLSNTLGDYVGGQATLRPANYDDVSAMAGLEYRQSALLLYRALVGYEVRSPIGAGIYNKTIAAPAAELDVIWKPSTLTVVNGTISQSLQNQPTDTTQGLTATTVQIGITQSLRRDLTFDATAGYSQAAFPNTSEVQSIFTASGEVTLSLNRNIAVSLIYDFTHADDNTVAAFRFDRHEVLLQVRLQL